MKTEVTIRTGTKPENIRQVPATLIKGTHFALTNPVGHRESWTLTHIPTGWRVAGSSRQRTLRAVAQRLSQLPIDWSSTDADSLGDTRDLCVPIIRELTGND